MKFEELLSNKIIIKLVETEKSDYLKFFENTYKDNLRTAYDNLKKHPRWTIISGYYAMHDLAKFFLAKQFSLKINKRVHIATIICLEEVLKDKKLKNEITKLLEKAENIFSTNITRYLEKGKREREKVQYYNFKTDFSQITDNASHFIEDVVNPFIKIVERLLK